MKKIIIAIILTHLFIGAMCQKTHVTEINIYLGERKTGVGFSYGIARHMDVLLNLGISRYFSVGGEAQFKGYLFSNETGQKKRVGTPFLGIGYEYINGAKFNREDSRHFVTGYYIPDNRYVSGEIGYRFYGKSKTDASGHKIRNVDISVSALYYWGLQNGYSAYVRTGTDVDGRVTKINNFMDGGWGAAATIHIPLKLISGNR